VATAPDGTLADHHATAAAAKSAATPRKHKTGFIPARIGLKDWSETPAIRIGEPLRDRSASKRQLPEKEPRLLFCNAIRILTA